MGQFTLHFSSWKEKIDKDGKIGYTPRTTVCQIRLEDGTVYSEAEVTQCENQPDNRYLGRNFALHKAMTKLVNVEHEDGRKYRRRVRDEDMFSLADVALLKSMLNKKQYTGLHKGDRGVGKVIGKPE